MSRTMAYNIIKNYTYPGRDQTPSQGIWAYQWWDFIALDN